MGLQDFGASGGTETADLGRISLNAADGSDFGFSLRDALEPAGQPVEGRAVHGRLEANEAEAGGAVCAGAAGLVCVEEREVGARVYPAGPRSAGILGEEWISRSWGSVEGAEVFGRVERGKRLLGCESSL